NDPKKTSPGACGCGKPETDANGNGVPDCIDPTLGPCPGNITVDAASSDGIAVDFMLPAGSSPIGGTTVTSVPPSGSVLPVGTTPVMITVTDTKGVTASCTFTVTVNPPAPVAAPVAETAPTPDQSSQAQHVDRDALRLLLTIFFRAPICGAGLTGVM